MKRIKNYLTYLLESIFYVEDDLIKILSNTKSPVAEVILNLIGNDIKINFNRLKITDKNSLIEFLPDSKVKGDPDWSMKGNQAKVGRLFKDILISNGHSEFSDKDIEDFVNKFKSAYDSKDENNLNIKIVRGEDIITYYDGENYKMFDGGTLNKSCMRYKKCSKYFGIYTDNPDVCGLVVYLDKEGLVISRALLWNLNYSNKDYEMYLDRIYYNHQEDAETLKGWVTEKFKDKKLAYHQGSPGGLNVKLENYDFDKYPYMDTFANLDNDILNNEGDGDRSLQQTDGGFGDDLVWCEMEGESYSEDEVIYIQDRDISCHSENARYSEYRGQYYWYEDVVSSRYHDHDYIPIDDSVYSAHLDDHIIADEANVVFLNDERTKEDYYPADTLNDEYGEYDDNYYIMKLLIESDSGYILKSMGINCYPDDEEEYYTKIDALIYNKDIDEQKPDIFDIGEYNNDLYFHKFFSQEIEFIKNRISELSDISEDDADIKVKEYTDWHEKQMGKKKRYYSRQVVFEAGGYKKFIESKSRYIFSKIDEVIGKDSIDMAIKYSLKLNAIDNRDEGGISNIPEWCVNVKKMMNFLRDYINNGVKLNKSDNSNIKYDILQKYEYDLRPYLSIFIGKICEFLFEENNKKTSVFMLWNDSKWIDYCEISDNLFQEDKNILGIN